MKITRRTVNALSRARISRILIPLLGLLSALFIGGLVGWAARGRSTAATPPASTCLRLSGYQFVNPLLACDTASDTVSPALASLRSKLEKLVEAEKRAGHVTQASVFFRDPASSRSIEVNPNEKYYPASLNKVPTMIAAYKMAEADPDFLKKEITFTEPTNANAGIEIQPRTVMAPGTPATVEEAIETMIRYSDNNAFYALAGTVDPKLFESTFNDLKISPRLDPNSPADYLTAKDFSYFLRILYNATYLTRDYSEEALRTLSETDFTDGIVAGVPAGTKVAHKFGINTTGSGTAINRELHDCGYVYQGASPYLLCVMTKSSGSLSDAEQTIRKISELTYKEAEDK